jgi:hypothetical protein
MSWCVVRFVSTVTKPGSKKVDPTYNDIVIDNAFLGKVNSLLKKNNELGGALRIHRICFCVDALHRDGKVKVKPIDTWRTYTDANSLTSTIKRVLKHQTVDPHGSLLRSIRSVNTYNHLFNKKAVCSYL